MPDALAAGIAAKASVVLARLDRLSHRAVGLAPNVRDVMGEALDELAAALEELHRAQEELREGRRRYQELFDFAPDGYLITDGLGSIRMANLAAIERLAGGRLRMLVGKPLTLFVTPEHRTEFFLALERVRTAGARSEWVGRLAPRGGEPFPAALVVVARPNGDGEATELLWLVHDLSERFREALVSSEEAFRRLAENSPDPIVRLGLDLRVEYANVATERLTGRRAGEIRGASAGELGLAAEGAEAWQEACRRALDGAEQVVEVPLETPAGRRWLESRIAPEYGVGRVLERLLVVSRDVTERRRAEQALRESDDLKTAMLASVSHELRTPLTAIAAAAHALAESGPADPGDLLGLITGETGRLERMVANLLDLSRLQGSAVTPRLEAYPVETLVGAALEAAGPVIADAPIRMDLDAAAPFVLVDPLMAERILVNLLHNAVTHGSPPVRVTSRRAADGAAVEISVADAGPGVPPGEERRIFQPFVHGGSPGSAGIGLSLARALAEAQGGDVRLRRPGPGACFVLTLAGASVADAGDGGQESATSAAAG